jgi:26S proteasome non-ATPase regulatory subunit 10
LEQKPPASARVKDKRGQYAIHRAAAVGSVPIVELLIKNKSPISATDVAGQTPLHHAVAEGHGMFCSSNSKFLVKGFGRKGVLIKKQVTQQ